MKNPTIQTIEAAIKKADAMHSMYECEPATCLPGRYYVQHKEQTHRCYLVDTCPGHSGSPVWMREGTGTVVVAIHTGGPTRATDGASWGCRPTSTCSAQRFMPCCTPHLRCPLMAKPMRWPCSTSLSRS